MEPITSVTFSSGWPNGVADRAVGALASGGYSSDACGVARFAGARMRQLFVASIGRVQSFS